MKKKDELKVDRELEELGIRSRIYIFDVDVTPFTAITIAEDILTWAGVRRELNNCLPHVRLVRYERATRLRSELRKRDIYGIAICDSREPNQNKRRGRTIAKGRLLKHLKEIGVRKVDR